MKLIYLNVPYANKDEAKKLGARWDFKEKKWFVTMNQDFSLFEKWMPDTPYFGYLNEKKQSDQKNIDAALEHLEYYVTCPIVDHPVLGECRLVGNNPFYWQ